MTQEMLTEKSIEVPMTVPEASEKHKISREAIYSAIQKGRLKSCKINDKNYLLNKDLEEYLQSKFSSDIRRVGGDLLCDPEKKEMTVIQTARYMKVSVSTLYNLIRRGDLKSHRKSKYWIICEDDVLKYMESLEDKEQMSFA